MLQGPRAAPDPRVSEVPLVTLVLVAVPERPDLLVRLDGLVRMVLPVIRVLPALSVLVEVMETRERLDSLGRQGQLGSQVLAVIPDLPEQPDLSVLQEPLVFRVRPDQPVHQVRVERLELLVQLGHPDFLAIPDHLDQLE